MLHFIYKVFILSCQPLSINNLQIQQKDPQKVIVINQAPESNIQEFLEVNGDWIATHRVDLSTMEESS